jgi:hypothetical protein
LFSVVVLAITFCKQAQAAFEIQTCLLAQKVIRRYELYKAEANKKKSAKQAIINAVALALHAACACLLL